MKKKYDIITALDICADLIVDAGNETIEFGQKEKFIQDYNFEMGGSSCIFVSQASKLDLKVLGIGVTGNDLLGRFMLDKLKNSGIYTEYVREQAGAKTSLSNIICINPDRAILTYNETIDAVRANDFTDDLMQNSLHLHIASFFLTKKLQPDYLEIVRKAKKYGMTISLDTNWDPDEKWDGGLWDILPYVDIFLPNENEIMAIAGCINNKPDLKRLTDIVPIVVVKKGKVGASAYSNEREYFCASIDVNAVDTVGAGDSFDAGFVYGFLAGYDIEKCLKIGCICGGMNTTKAGGTAGQINADMLRELMSK